VFLPLVALPQIFLEETTFGLIALKSFTSRQFMSYFEENKTQIMVVIFPLYFRVSCQTKQFSQTPVKPVFE
jgi:hypothetical protein